MINWKEFWIGFFSSACIMLFVAAIDQHEKYEKVIEENNKLKWELKMTRAGQITNPVSSECTKVFDDMMINCEENKIWKGR